MTSTPDDDGPGPSLWEFHYGENGEKIIRIVARSLEGAIAGWRKFNDDDDSRFDDPTLIVYVAGEHDLENDLLVADDVA